MPTVLSGVAAVGAVVACAGLALGRAGAQPEPVAVPGAPAATMEEATAERPSGATARLTLGGQHTFASEFKDAPGEVGVSRGSAELALSFPLRGSWRLGVGMDTEISSYDFTDATGFVAGTDEPWDETAQFSLSATASTRIGERWGAFFGGGVDSSAQFGADFADSITGGVFAGGSYAFSDRFTLGFGAGVRTRLEDNALVLPVISIDYRFADRWRLGSRQALNSFGLELSYEVTDAVTLGVDVAYEGRAYRLDDEGPVPEGVGRDWRLPAAFSVGWKVMPQVTLAGRAGVAFFQEYTLDDEDGDEINEIEADPAAFAGATLTFDF